MENNIIGAPALSVIESEIIRQLVTNTSRSSVADSLGIPVESVVQLLRKKGVKEWIAELKITRKEQMLTYATEVVAASLRDKVALIEDDEERSLGSATKKDHIEIAKTLTDMLKGQTSSEEHANNPMAQIYQQINILQQENQSKHSIDAQIIKEDS